MWSQESFELIAGITRDIIRKNCHEYAQRVIKQETAFTASLLTRLRDNLNGLTLTANYKLQHGFRPSGPPRYEIRATETLSNAVHSEENLSGADMVFGFKGEVHDDVVDKAALVQAKIWDGTGQFLGLPKGKAKRDELLAQCKRMRRISQASYVFIYTKDAIRCYHADDIISKSPEGVNYSDGWDFTTFMHKFFHCTIGDRNLNYMVEGDFRPHLRELGISDGFMVELEQV
ncbi:MULTISPECIES: hypothetical protein [unclassified Sinorhizobium]|uniref:hypothetical protein n=1 Tax=unclassified Sinorhizobium TaxID=2613772 RepID=UPI0024C3FAE3|nr:MULTISPECIES: hypothetical protein [unclassified Sinorhizobium]MDK1378165.1 hypothetical protein [Sinorhizobium sp. 6-70]MDK1479786.1 hypothetical protein [Sinorhizobium sp. 6-117]